MKKKFQYGLNGLPSKCTYSIWWPIQTEADKFFSILGIHATAFRTPSCSSFFSRRQNCSVHSGFLQHGLPARTVLLCATRIIIIYIRVVRTSKQYKNNFGLCNWRPSKIPYGEAYRCLRSVLPWSSMSMPSSSAVSRKLKSSAGHGQRSPIGSIPSLFYRLRYEFCEQSAKTLATPLYAYLVDSPPSPFSLSF